MVYEQAQGSTIRRGVWVVLWLVVIVAVLWTAIWLVFLRHPAKKVSTLHGASSTSQDQQAAGTGQSSQSSTGSGSAGSTGSGSSGAATTTQPTQLANTGAGNVMVPFAIASVAGGVLYYVRLRRKVLS